MTNISFCVILRLIKNTNTNIEDIIEKLTEKAVEIENDDIERCKKMVFRKKGGCSNASIANEFENLW